MTLVIKTRAKVCCTQKFSEPFSDRALLDLPGEGGGALEVDCRSLLLYEELLESKGT